MPIKIVSKICICLHKPHLSAASVNLVQYQQFNINFAQWCLSICIQLYVILYILICAFRPSKWRARLWQQEPREACRPQRAAWACQTGPTSADWTTIPGLFVSLPLSALWRPPQTSSKVVNHKVVPSFSCIRLIQSTYCGCWSLQCSR